MMEKRSKPVAQILMMDSHVILGKTFSGLDLLVLQVNIELQKMTH